MKNCENSSHSSHSSEGGNTSTPSVKKQISPGYRWLFTWNNYPDNWKDIILKAIVPNNWEYAIGEEICPTTGTPHLQGFIYHPKKKKIRPLSLNLNRKIHWDKPKGNKQQCYQYCIKDDKYITNMTNVEKPYKIDIKLYEWQKGIVKILDSKPDDRTIHWFWEPDGKAGKTTFQKWIFLNYERVMVLSGKASDIKNGIVQYKLKNKVLPKIILINIPRCQDHISWGGIEQVKDMFFYSPKYEGGMVCGPNPHVMIFSNKEPAIEAMSQDRWKITRL